MVKTCVEENRQKKQTYKLQTQGVTGKIDRECEEQYHQRESQGCGLKIYFLSIFFIAGIGVYFFCKGFLLARREMENKSSLYKNSHIKEYLKALMNVSELEYHQQQQQQQHHQYHHHHHHHLDSYFDQKIDSTSQKDKRFTMWPPRQYNHVVLFIIDALRFDFVAGNPYETRNDVTEEEKSIFRGNQFSIFKNMLRLFPEQSFLFKFRADAPTTTSQRLKALTTGGLPTFIDAGKNFDTDEILEDNLIYQWVSRGLKIVALGDDTWGSLYPTSNHYNMTYFIRSRLFPSFDTMDLHTVDDGILKYLDTEISSYSNDIGLAPDRSPNCINHKGDKCDGFKNSANNYHDSWDVLISHFLGVDHAGHKYGIYHKEMRNKLIQMNETLSRVIERMPEDAILFCFGDHGMNENGDHGGGSDVEVDSALFIFSKKKFKKLDLMKQMSNIRSDKIKNSHLDFEYDDDVMYRTIYQTDIVPTLSLLLGSAIPFGNLGSVIPEVMLALDFTICSSFNQSHVSHGYQLLQAILAYHINSHQIRNYIEKYRQIDKGFISDHIYGELSALIDQSDLRLESLIAKYSHSNSRQDFDCESFLGDSDNLKRDLLEIFFNYDTFLREIAKICREQWSSFDTSKMLLGLGLIFIALLLCCWQIKRMRWYDYGDTAQLYLTIAVVFMIIYGTQSNSFIVYEDRIIIYFSVTGLLIELRKIVKFSSLWRGFLFLFIGIVHLVCIRCSYTTLRFRMHGTHHIQNLQSNHCTPLMIIISLLVQYIVWVIFQSVRITGLKKENSIAYPLGYTMIPLSYLCTAVYLCGRIYGTHWEEQSKYYLQVMLWIPRFLFFCWLVYSLEMIIKFISRKSKDSKLFSSTNWFQHSCLILLILKGHNYTISFLLLSIQVITFLLMDFLVNQEEKEHSLNDQYENQGNTFFVMRWWLMAMQYYFATGQQNTFNTIQWLSAFVGLDGAHIIMGGILVTICVFSTKILFSFSIPLILMNRRDTNHRRETQSNYATVYNYFLLGLLSLISATICVTIHRRHLMVWAIFAPKFLFEVSSFVLTSALLLISSLFF